MKSTQRLIIPLFTALLLGGCVTAPEPFNWYHPMGGEHLFAFDADECTAQSAALGQALTAKTDSPFFVCMRARGYALVDEQGNLLEPVAATVAAGPHLSQQ